jgi:hypothetical protein
MKHPKLLPTFVLSLLFGLTQGAVYAQKIGDSLAKQQELKGTLAMPNEMNCLGFIHDSLLPMDIYVSGVEEEGLATFVTENSLVYLSGPGLKNAKAGDVFKAVRPEARIRDRFTQQLIGNYYKELGTVRIEALRPGGATGTVLLSCNLMFKGDVLVPFTTKAPVKFTGDKSTRMTPYPEGGLATTIVLGKDDRREMSEGTVCFIPVGTREGVKPGDRFTIYRLQPPFDPKDLIVNTAHVRSNVEGSSIGGAKTGAVQSPTSYEPTLSGRYNGELIQKLMEREVPHRVLGDLVVLEAGETTSSAKIITSRTEIHIGDIVVRR